MCEEVTQFLNLPIITCYPTVHNRWAPLPNKENLRDMRHQTTIVFAFRTTKMIKKSKSLQSIRKFPAFDVFQETHTNFSIRQPLCFPFGPCAFCES